MPNKEHRMMQLIKALLIIFSAAALSFFGTAVNAAPIPLSAPTGPRNSKQMQPRPVTVTPENARKMEAPPLGEEYGEADGYVM
ncbi:MAG: hypothetical protein M1831_001969 [Alyxoria varia]|nr:MAG: hypothetical protein M1831_001969 [Alyxoria varia]